MAAARRERRALHAAAVGYPLSGHAIEARLCAEDPAQNFLPQAGRIALWRPADGVRTDHALESGAEISPFYDLMIAKVIAHGATRDEARERLARALDNTVALGVRDQQGLSRRRAARRGIRAGPTTDFLAPLSAIEPAEPDAATLAIAAALLAANAGLRRVEFLEQQSGADDAGKICRDRRRPPPFR